MPTSFLPYSSLPFRDDLQKEPLSPPVQMPSNSKSLKTPSKPRKTVLWNACASRKAAERWKEEGEKVGTKRGRMAIRIQPHHYGDGRFPLVWSLIMPLFSTPRLLRFAPSRSPGKAARRQLPVANAIRNNCLKHPTMKVDPVRTLPRTPRKKNERKKPTSNAPVWVYLPILDVSGDFPYSVSFAPESRKRRLQNRRFERESEKRSFARLSGEKGEMNRREPVVETDVVSLGMAPQVSAT